MTTKTEQTVRVKVGDRVRCVDDFDRNSIKAGHEYVVRRADEVCRDGSQGIRLEGTQDIRHSINRFELLDAGAAWEPKVGDRVRVRPEFNSPRAGAPGTITEVGVYGGYIRVDVDGHGRGFDYERGDLFPLEVPPREPGAFGAALQKGLAAHKAANECKSCGRGDQRGLVEGFCCYCERRLRGIQELRFELDRALPKKAANKHDARPADLEQAWSTPSWES